LPFYSCFLIGSHSLKSSASIQNFFHFFPLFQNFSLWWRTKNSTQPKSQTDVQKKTLPNQKATGHWNERSSSQTGHYQHLRAHFHLSMRSPTELSTHTRALSIGSARSRICPGMGGKQKCKLQREKWLYLVLCSIYCTRCVCSSVDHVSLWSASCNKALKNIPHIWRKWIECVHPGKDTSAGNTSYIIHP